MICRGHGHDDIILITIRRFGMDLPTVIGRALADHILADRREEDELRA